MPIATVFDWLAALWTPTATARDSVVDACCPMAMD